MKVESSKPRTMNAAERLADAVLSYAERKPVEFAELVHATADGRLKRAVAHALRDPDVRGEVVARVVRAAATAARRSL